MITISKNKLQYVENKLEDNINSQTLEWINQRYIPYLKRQGLSEGTKSNRLQALSKLVLIEELRPEKLSQKQPREIKSLGEKVAGNIQANKYVEKGSGGMCKRRKRMIWTTFKNIIELENHSINNLPDFKPKETKKINRRANTEAENLPNPSQTKKFIKSVAKHSADSHTLRNQALILLMWDKGPRIGEALNIQLKDCNIDNDKLEIFIEGNKGSQDRTITVYQGRETLKEFIRTHPGSGDDYLFSDLMHGNLDSGVGRSKFAEKIKQVHTRESCDFKVAGEPNHIFRKAMVTSHIVNEWATWEEVCKLQGKKGDSTKPAYLKMALNDVNASVGEKIGAVGEEDKKENHMLGEPLLPQKCSSCEKINKCFLTHCQYCSGDLTTPQRTAFQEETETLEEIEEMKKKILENPNLSPKEIKQEVKENTG